MTSRVPTYSSQMGSPNLVTLTSRKWPSKECAPLKQAHPTTPAPKSGRENNTRQSAISGRLAVYCTKCACWPIHSRAGTSHHCIGKLLSAIMIKSPPSILISCRNLSECVLLLMMRWDHQQGNCFKQQFWAEWTPTWTSSTAKVQLTWLMPSSVQECLNSSTPNYLSPWQRTTSTRKLSTSQRRRKSNAHRDKVSRSTNNNLCAKLGQRRCCLHNLSKQ